MDAKRGYIPEDEKNFSPQSIDKMKTASRQITWLLNEGYDLKQATVFVGNHFLLSERQRLAIMRSVASKKQILERRKKQADAVLLYYLGSGNVDECLKQFERDLCR